MAYTRSWARPAEMEPEAAFAFTWSGGEPPTSSLPAQIAAKVAEAMGPDEGRRYHRRLLEAYFTEHRTISDWDVLGELATESGLDRTLFDERVATDRRNLASEVIDEHNEAIGLQIHAVPTVVMADVLPVPGAQDVDTYAQLVTRVRERVLG